MEVIVIVGGIVALILGLDLAGMRWGAFNQAGGEKELTSKKPAYHPGNCCLV